jgi:hypothetical protein
MQVVYGFFAVVLFAGACVGLLQSPVTGAAAFGAWALYMLLWQILRTLMAILDKIGQPITIRKGRPEPVPVPPPGFRSPPMN